MNKEQMKEMKGDVFTLLDENPHFTKGNIIQHFQFPIFTSKDDGSQELSYIIWVWNKLNGRDGYYSLTPNQV